MTLPSRPGRLRVGVHPGPDLGDGGFDEVGGGPVRPGARDVEHEVAQHLPAARGVHDLRMELDPVQAPVGVDQAGIRGGIGLGGRAEALRQPRDGVAVAHPDRLLPVQAAEQPVIRGDREGGRAVLPPVGGQDVTTELDGHQLGAVADAQDGQTAAPDRAVRPGCARVVDGVGAAGEDDALGAPIDDRPERGVVRHQLRVDVQLAHAARDELGELAAEVEHDHAVGRFRGDEDRGPVVRGTVGRRRVERDLQVGLHLRVIRREDPVAGVGERAVHGLAALRRRGGPRGGGGGGLRGCGRLRGGGRGGLVRWVRRAVRRGPLVRQSIAPVGPRRPSARLRPVYRPGCAGATGGSHRVACRGVGGRRRVPVRGADRPGPAGGAGVADPPEMSRPELELPGRPCRTANPVPGRSRGRARCRAPGASRCPPPRHAARARDPGARRPRRWNARPRHSRCRPRTRGRS